MPDDPSPPPPRLDPVLKSARREAVVVFFVWLAAMTWTVGYCALHAYGRDPQSLTFVLGFPDWIFWGVIVPWAICVVVSWAFGAIFMRDEDLGQELESDDDGL